MLFSDFVRPPTCRKWHGAAQARDPSESRRLSAQASQHQVLQLNAWLIKWWGWVERLNGSGGTGRNWSKKEKEGLESQEVCKTIQSSRQLLMNRLLVWTLPISPILNQKLKVPLHAQAFGIQAVVEVLPFSLAQRGARVDPDISCTMTSTVWLQNDAPNALVDYSLPLHLLDLLQHWQFILHGRLKLVDTPKMGAKNDKNIHIYIHIYIHIDRYIIYICIYIYIYIYIHTYYIYIYIKLPFADTWHKCPGIHAMPVAFPNSDLDSGHMAGEPHQHTILGLERWFTSEFNQLKWGLCITLW